MLNIQTVKKNDLSVMMSKNNLDKPLCKDIPDMLPNYSGFSFLICGSSGSGKTTLLYSLMCQNKKNKKRTSYKKLFDKIYVVSPTIGNKSIKDDPFSKLPDEQIIRELTYDVLKDLEQKIQENREEEKNSIIIFDDVGSQLRKSAQIEKKLTQMIQNRRHDYTSYFILLQRFRDAPTGIRNNLSHFISFRPKNRPETEAITNEMFNLGTKETVQLMQYIYDDDDTDHPFLYVDMSLKKSNKYKFYKKFDELMFDSVKPSKESHNLFEQTEDENVSIQAKPEKEDDKHISIRHIKVK